MVDIIGQALADRVFPGIVCGAWKDGREVFGLSEGWAVPPDDPDFEPRPMTRDVRFDAASLTKPLATAILAMQAAESGAIRLTDPLSRYLPGLPARTGEIPLCTLLTHDSGLPAIPAIFLQFPDASAVERSDAVRRLLAIEPERRSGEAVVYSCTGFMILGVILEAVSEMRLGRLFRERIAEPLGLGSAGFLPVSQSRDRQDRSLGDIAPTEICAWRGKRMRGQVHDESAWCLDGESGNAGLFAGLDDLRTIASLYLQEGTAAGKRLLSPESVHLMTTPQTDAPGERRAYGLRLHDGGTFDGPAWPDTAFGHTGFTGTSVFMEPGSRLMAVTLTNRVYYGRAETALKMPDFRREYHTRLWRAFAE